MHAEQNFDSRVREALTKECDGILASDELKIRIDDRIHKEQEGNTMKHMSVKKLCVGVAAACLLVSGITVFAGGAAGRFAVSVSEESQYTDYRDLDKAQKKMGHEVDSVEQFTNGYAFVGASVVQAESYTEEGAKAYSIPMMDIRYEKGESKISLMIMENREKDVSSREPGLTRTCGDITLWYDECMYKVIPAEYEIAEEDMDHMQQGSNVISETTTVMVTDWTAEELEEGEAGGEEGVLDVGRTKTVRWEKDGVTYDLVGSDLDLSGEEMLDMAEEIISSGK